MLQRELSQFIIINYKCSAQASKKELSYSQVLIILIWVKKKILNWSMKRGKPFLLFCVWEVNWHICPWRNYVELGVKNVNSMDHTVQTRHGESCVALILANCVFTDGKRVNNFIKPQLTIISMILIMIEATANNREPSGNFLVGASDDKISIIHRN